MSDENVVPFLEFLRRRKGEDAPDVHLAEVFRKDLREQTDLLHWYGFHRLFNKHKLFLHLLFSANHREESTLQNTGYVLALTPDDLSRHMEGLLSAIEWAGRKALVIEAEGKTIRKMCRTLSGFVPPTDREAWGIFRNTLLHSDYVLIVRQLSKSSLRRGKTAFARSLIKIRDDAPIDGLYPASDLVFIDDARFLQRSWTSIGLYLEVLV